jgi:hypothetical protein
MITSIADHQLEPDVVDALRHRDPLLGDTLVVEPFPDAGLNELIADINGELGVSPPNSRESRDPKLALSVLMDSHVHTIVIVGAEALTREALREFTHLRHVDRLRSVVLVAGVNGHDVREIADATPSPPRLTDLVAQYAEPVLPASMLSRSHHDLADTTIASIAFLARRIGHTIDTFPKAQLRLGILAAALQLFDRPRSPAGTLVRLHGLDVALHQRGHRLRPGSHRHAVKHCAARTQLDLWLPDAVVPSPRRNGCAPLDAALDRSLPATPTTLAAWISGFDRSRTRNLYENAARQLLDWRARNDIAERDHDPGHLEDWAFDRLRAGAAIGTVTMHHNVARRYHIYLLTGQHNAAIKPPPYTLRSGLPPIALPNDLQARLHSAAHFRETPTYINVLSRRYRRTPLVSPQARRLLELFDNDLARAWRRIEALRIPRVLAYEIGTLLRATSPYLVARRQIPNLNGVLIVLGTGIPWAGLPRELNYGSGASAYRRLNEWVREDRWPTIRDRLRDHGPIYSDLAWDRVPTGSGDKGSLIERPSGPLQLDRRLTGNHDLKPIAGTRHGHERGT